MGSKLSKAQSRFKIPQPSSFNRKNQPAQEFLDSIKANFSWSNQTDEEMTKAFPLYLKGQPAAWYRQLEDNLKESFEILIQAFKDKYITPVDEFNKKNFSIKKGARIYQVI